MGNDTDRLQQMEDNWNAGDSIYQALGVQQSTMRRLIQEVHGEELSLCCDAEISEFGYCLGCGEHA